MEQVPQVRLLTSRFHYTVERNHLMKTALKISSPLREFSYFTFGMTFIGIILLSILQKGDIVLMINAISNSDMDFFFRNYTNLGLGLIMAIISIYFLFVSYYYAILSFSSLLIAGIFTFFFKHVLFLHMPRPTKYFEYFDGLRMIEGIHFHSWCSFPSGHTMTAFASATIICLAAKNKGTGVFVFILAALVALSRIYLLQHFFMDVYAGALLGITYTILLHMVLKRYEPKLNQNLIIHFLQWKQQKKEKLEDVKPRPSLR